MLEVKNISADPLNISADELMERFKRGDESRNTEGSGLGLANSWLVSKIGFKIARVNLFLCIGAIRSVIAQLLPIPAVS